MYHHFDFSHCSIELSDKDALKYLAGECLTCANEGTGYKIVTYQNLPLGFVKQVGHQLKNHYPKGLRKKINCQV